MITHWNFLLAVGLAMFGYTLARPDPYLSDLNPKADIPGEELYNELVDEIQKLHSQEVTYLQHLGAVAARQLRQEDLIQQQQQALEDQSRQRHHQQFADEPLASLLDDIPMDSLAKNSNRAVRLQEPLKPLPYQKAKDEKKSNHPYMSLCHFKLCNMGRKRNTRFLHFWK